MSVPRFWREIPQRYNLQAAQCGVCKSTYFPPRVICPKCRRASIGKMQVTVLAGRGRILEFTRVHKPAPGYEMQVPYFVALVQTEEGPLVTGQIVDSDPALLREGVAVQAVFRRLGADGESGVIYYGTKWQIVPPPRPLKSAKPGKPDVAEAKHVKDAAPRELGRVRRFGRKKPA